MLGRKEVRKIMVLPDWLPLIGTIAAGPLIAALVIFLKKMGLLNTPVSEMWATLILAIVWCVLALLANLFPDIQPAIVAIIQFIAALLGAAGGFSFKTFGRKAITSL